MIALPTATSRWTILREETWKLSAFLRRDLLVMLSYRLAFISDWFNLIVQVFIFYLVGKLVRPESLPRYGGDPTTYVEFAAVGIAMASLIQVGLVRVVTAIRSEQMMGTLESLFVTPTSPSTVQIGSVSYDLAYVPLRTILFLALTSALLNTGIDMGGLGPTIGILFAFIPLIWGIGMINAATVLTFRRGGGLVGMFTVIMGLGSSAYVPLEAMPSWLQVVAEKNPLTVALEGARTALLGSGGWSDVTPAILKLLPWAIIAMVLGVYSFRLALHRERRKGTLGQY
jgi:ABC-2 type transport system permease protein